MKKATVYNADYLFQEETMEFEVPVEIHVSRFYNHERIVEPGRYDLPFNDPNAFKVYMNMTEPENSPNREFIPSVILNADQYDLILTTDVDILQHCGNAVMFPYGSTWLNKTKINHPDGLGFYDESLNELHTEKKFEISFLCSFHNRNIEGYNRRKELWFHQNKITTPKRFYSSSRYLILDNKLPDDDKKHLFKSRFHIAIESCKVENYFSEKLIDALITKTIPIYWGCPNIGDFFDERGMFIIDSKNSVFDLCNNLNEETYNNKLKYVEENFERAKEYARPLCERVKEEISKAVLDRHKT